MGMPRHAPWRVSPPENCVFGVKHSVNCFAVFWLVDSGCRCFIFNLSLIILVGAKIVGKFSENNHIYARRNRRFVVGEFGEFYVVGHWAACILIRSGTVGTVGPCRFLYFLARIYT